MLKKLGSVTGISTPFNPNRKRFIKEFRRLKEFPGIVRKQTVCGTSGQTLQVALKSQGAVRTSPLQPFPPKPLLVMHFCLSPFTVIGQALRSLLMSCLAAEVTGSDPLPLIHMRNSAAGSMRSAEFAFSLWGLGSPREGIWNLFIHQSR